MVRQNNVESVAQTVEDEEFIGYRDHNQKGVVKGPLEVSDIFADESSLPYWRQDIDTVWVEVFLFSILIRLRQLRSWHLGVIALLCVYGKRVLILFNLSETNFFELFLLLVEF